MALLRRGLTVALLAGAFASPESRRPVTVGPRGDAGGSSPRAIYLPQSKEYYLTADQFDFARPVCIRPSPTGEQSWIAADVTQVMKGAAQ